MNRYYNYDHQPDSLWDPIKQLIRTWLYKLSMRYKSKPSGDDSWKRGKLRVIKHTFPAERLDYNELHQNVRKELMS